MIIIPDTEMPNSCDDCPLEYDSICCRAFDIEFYPLYSYDDYCTKRHPDCKLRELVLCKDCKWYGRADKRRFYRGMDCLQKRIDTIIPDKDFCSRGERKDDE